MIAALLLLIVGGSIIYCLLVIVAARDYRAEVPPAATAAPPLSVLKPLSGVDEGLEQNLRSFFTQDYPAFELLFAVRTEQDPAVRVVEQLRQEFPAVASRLIVTGEPPYPNAKVFSLDRMTQAARHDILVMSDSDIRVGSAFLRRVADEFEAGADLATCPYRAVAGASYWSQLEAVGMNTEFLGGVLVARLVEGMKFALGPTLIARRRVIDHAGGWDELSQFLAEDFVLGNRAAEGGFRVILSSYVIEHRIGSQDLEHNLAHRLRWNRSTRRSRPAGYAGQLFTYPLALALLMWLIVPKTTFVVAMALAARIAAAYFTAVWVLGAPLPLGKLVIQDLVSFGLWIAGFFGDTIVWRGIQYRLLPDGRFERV